MVGYKYTVDSMGDTIYFDTNREVTIYPEQIVKVETLPQMGFAYYVCGGKKFSAMDNTLDVATSRSGEKYVVDFVTADALSQALKGGA